VCAHTQTNTTTFKKFQWQAKPVIHSVDNQFKDAGAVYVVDDRLNEYIFEKEGFFMYRTVHRIVHINNDNGIENFNKIYLPFDEGIEMVDVKARTVLPDGKIMEMDKKNIKDLKDDDGQYKIFALEGLTHGCEVEYYFILKKNPSFFGREVISARIPTMKSHFELIAPDHLAFETRSFNDLPVSRDTVIAEKRFQIIDDNLIPEAPDEKYSMYQANLKRVDYKLCYNKARNATERLFTWNELAKKVYDVYNTFSDKENKKIKDLLQDINIKGSGEVDKITAIENYLKKNFVSRDNIPDEDAGDLTKVIKDKFASEKAICKLYAGLFNAAQVNFQIVLTGDRTDYTIERNFENWNNGKNFIFFFPATKKFLAPTQEEYRYPWIPPTWASTNGLYCVGTTIGNFTTAVAEIKNIPMEDVSRNYINMDVSMKVNKDESLTVDVKQIYGGYAAPNYKLPFVFLPAEQQDNVLKELIKFGTNSENILSHSFENREMEQKDPYKPFVINASVKSTNLIERAGEKLLLKIGEIIGEQVEMYDTKERKTNVELAFPHTLVRNIEFTIPDGYTIKNLADLKKMNITVKENEKDVMGFVTSYEQKGNTLKINITETYNKITYPKQQYEDFKKVINASADFNNVVLILDKA